MISIPFILLEVVSFISCLFPGCVIFLALFMTLVSPLFHLMSLMTRVFAVFHWHAWEWCSRLCYLICSVGESDVLSVTETIHLTFCVYQRLRRIRIYFAARKCIPKGLNGI